MCSHACFHGCRVRREFVPGRVIVKFDHRVSAAKAAAVEKTAGVTGLERTLLGGARVVSVAGDVETAVARLNRSSAVQYAEADYILRANAIPSDTRFGERDGTSPASARSRRRVA